jgi:hypothetical protein
MSRQRTAIAKRNTLRCGTRHRLALVAFARIFLLLKLRMGGQILVLVFSAQSAKLIFVYYTSDHYSAPPLI